MNNILQKNNIPSFHYSIIPFSRRVVRPRKNAIFSFDSDNSETICYMFNTRAFHPPQQTTIKHREYIKGYPLLCQAFFVFSDSELSEFSLRVSAACSSAELPSSSISLGVGRSFKVFKSNTSRKRRVVA